MKKIEKNAIILAAGFGSRLVPLTFDCPKGLIKIRNESMIERQILFLKEKDINNICLVVGYKKDSFNFLKEKYGVKIIENEEFDKTNSLFSLFIAKKYLKNTYILNSDAWIENNFFNLNDEPSFLSCIKNHANHDVNEWKIDIDQNKRITNIVPRQTKKDEWFITGPSYFNEHTSSLFINEAEKLLKDKNNKKKFYWEQTFFEIIKKDQIIANKQNSNVFEVDNLDDLKKLDNRDEILLGSTCLKEITTLFNVSLNEIKEIEPLKKGLTNNSFSFVINNIKYVYRYPGAGTEKIIDRQKEYKIYQQIKNFKYGEKIYQYNQKTSTKISYFVKNSSNLDPHNDQQLRKAFSLLNQFHQTLKPIGVEFDISKEINNYKNNLKGSLKIVEKEKELSNSIEKLIKYIKELDVKKTLCHIDFIPENIIVDQEENLTLIDYEYAADADPMIDIAAFATTARYNLDELNKTIEYYFNSKTIDKTIYLRVYIYMALLGYLWWIWSYVFVDANNHIAEEYIKHMYDNACFYVNLIRKEFKNVC